MFPIRDHERPSRFGIVSYVLIALNVLVFLWELISPAPDQFIAAWAMTPARLGDPGAWVTLLTAQFLHADILHIAGNMWYLHIFGDNVEDRLGRGRFLLLYVSAGIVASFAQIAATSFHSVVPMLGASGAIAGVLGAYLALFPRNRIDAIVPYGFGVFGRTTLSAGLVLAFWFVLQLLSGGSSVASGEANMGGVAFFAHIGGFVYGWLIGKWIERSEPPIATRIEAPWRQGW